jgi:hypothetical protein
MASLLALFRWHKTISAATGRLWYHLHTLQTEVAVSSTTQWTDLSLVLILYWFYSAFPGHRELRPPVTQCLLKLGRFRELVLLCYCVDKHVRLT